MTTKADRIAALKLEFPTLKIGSDETGYTDLSDAEYEAKIESWADAILAKEELMRAKAKAEEEAVAAKAAAQAKLAALGLTADDLKALGLGNN